MNFRDELLSRMARPQRHRLLQGFPAVPAMVAAVPTREGAPPDASSPDFVRQLDGRLVDRAFVNATESLARGRPPPLPQQPDTPERRAQRERLEAMHDRNEAAWRELVARGDRGTAPLLTIDLGRELIVGVIPHTQCIPSREGCGFCTFPHDPANARSRGQMIEAVLADLERLTCAPPLEGRRVDAIYLGGGTANLSTPDQVTAIVATLARHLRIDGAELTLEGTPQLFDRLFASHLGNLLKQPVGTRRISLGLQTFDPAFLRLMGREKFGDASLVKKLVKRCAHLGITTSGDLLFNLPGQTAAQMDADLEVAIASGLEQICLYNLVLTEGLGTPWSRDPALVAKMPDVEAACAQWLRLRERLLRAGYVQSTLTNFEREDVARSDRRFRYEVASFSVERTDALGVGPLSLTTFVNLDEKRGVKLMRRKRLGRPAWSGGDLLHAYDEAGLRRLFVTRGLAKTRLEGAVFQRLFGATLWDALPAMDAVIGAGLATRRGDDLELTPRGMFFADAVVSVLALGGEATAGAGLHTRDLLAERPRPGEYLSMG